MFRTLFLTAFAFLVGCNSVPSPTTFLGVVSLEVVSGNGLGIGPRGGCGSVGFANLRLHGDASRSTAVWAEVVGPGTLLAVRWPPGFSARFEPQLVLYDAHRKPVARGGDVLTEGGGYPAYPPEPITLLSFNGVDYPCE